VYDYVIVGAGSAGCVLASRLTEDPAVRVLLLEAGGTAKGQEVSIPAAFSKLFKTDRDWDFTTEPELAIGGRELYWPRGRMLGGSSSMNAMIYIRGNRLDYDTWRDLGNPGWGYDDVLPYFRRSEDNGRGPDAYHGVDGPLAVSDPRCPNEMSVAFVEAAQKVGLPANDDFNGAEQDGVGLYQLTQRRGKGCSTAVAYFAAAARRPNLHVVTDAQVTLVQLTGTRATGVQALVGGFMASYRAGEVILAGGAINTPQLLMLSGIGPAQQLRAAGIRVVAESPGVGENLQDHPAVPLAYLTDRAAGLAGAESLPNVASYLLSRRGPLTSNIAEAGGFFRSREGLPAPDLQYLFAPVLFLDHGLAPPPGEGYTFAPTLVAPESRGHVRLRSADQLAKPLITVNYLTADADMAAMVAGVRHALDVGESDPLVGYRSGSFFPPLDADDDETVRSYIRQRVETLYHPVGTAAMGPADGRSVVDPQLRVHGVQGLRVADASVMPTVVRGNTNAPVIMIAEKAADLVKAG